MCVCVCVCMCVCVACILIKTRFPDLPSRSGALHMTFSSWCFLVPTRIGMIYDNKLTLSDHVSYLDSVKLLESLTSDNVYR